MKIIRTGMFETNSSSSHCIIVDRQDFVAPYTGPVIITEGEFGWGCEELCTWQERASYCYTDNKEDKKRIAMLKKVIEDFTQVKVEFKPGEGYVDHQSEGTSAEAFNDELSLKQTIFGKKTVILIDNDNH